MLAVTISGFVGLAIFQVYSAFGLLLEVLYRYHVSQFQVRSGGAVVVEVLYQNFMVGLWGLLELWE